MYYLWISSMMSNDKNAMFSQPQDVAGDGAQEDTGTTDPPMAMTFALMIIAFRRKKYEIIIYMCLFVVVDVFPSFKIHVTQF